MALGGSPEIGPYGAAGSHSRRNSFDGLLSGIPYGSPGMLSAADVRGLPPSRAYPGSAGPYGSGPGSESIVYPGSSSPTPAVMDAGAFVRHQWMLYRALVLRRYAAVQANGGGGLLLGPGGVVATPPMLDAALRHFGLPSTSGDLVSRPFNYSADPKTMKVDLRLPYSHETVPDMELRRIDSLDLPQEALGWDPAAASRRAAMGGGGSGAFGSPGSGGSGAAGGGAGEPDAATAAMMAGLASVGRTVLDTEGLDRAPLLQRLSAAVLALTASRRLKTKLCHAFQRTGRCTRGAGCQFAHGDSELRVNHVSNAACKLAAAAFSTVWYACGCFCGP